MFGLFNYFLTTPPFFKLLIIISNFSTRTDKKYMLPYAGKT